MGLLQPTFTDYSTVCGATPQTFFQMLANCVVSSVDDQGHTHCYLNIIADTEGCDDLEACFDCDRQGEDPERFLVNNLFALDECGHLGLKAIFNSGAAQ